MEPAEKSNAKHPPSQASLRPSIFTMISRGSAPSGTFDIPEEGLPVPHNKSFFARFQEGIPVAKSALQKYMELMEAVKLVPTNEQTKKGQDDEDAEDTVRVEVVHSTEKGKDKEEKIRMGGQPSGSQPAPEQIEMRNGAKDEQPSSLEIAADVAEDSLIEVVDEQISVLSDRHPSYPVLRFCAANALLDGHALDTLVSLCALLVAAGDRRERKSVGFKDMLTTSFYSMENLGVAVGIRMGTIWRYAESSAG